MTDFNELRKEKELINLFESSKYSWRQSLEEGKYQKGGEVEEKKEKKGDEDHPFVEVMPAEKDGKEVDKKKKSCKKCDCDPCECDSKKEVKEGLRLSLKPNTQFLEGKELSIDDQMRISREAAKTRNPKPDHKAIRGKMLKKPLPKDTRTDAQKMTDATGPRPGSRYRGD